MQKAGLRTGGGLKAGREISNFTKATRLLLAVILAPGIVPTGEIKLCERLRLRPAKGVLPGGVAPARQLARWRAAASALHSSLAHFSKPCCPDADLRWELFAMCNAALCPRLEEAPPSYQPPADVDYGEQPGSRCRGSRA